jgi:hypothetical protein
MISATSIRQSPEPGARFTAIGVDDDIAATSNFQKYFNAKLKAASIPFKVKIVSTFAEGERLIEDLTFINFAVFDFKLDKGMKGTVLCINLLKKNPRAQVFLFTASEPHEIGEIPDGVTVIWDKKHADVKAALDKSIDDFKLEQSARKNSAEGIKG